MDAISGWEGLDVDSEDCSISSAPVSFSGPSESLEVASVNWEAGLVSSDTGAIDEEGETGRRSIESSRISFDERETYRALGLARC